MNVAHFYHCYCVGSDWQPAVEEHVAALEGSGWDGPIYLGLVGAASKREKARSMFPAEAEIVAEANRGWEQVTISALHEWACGNSGDAVLYAHTKGAADPTDFNILWRRSMQKHVIEGWRDALAQLTISLKDAVGCHWLDPLEYPQYRDMENAFFGGNYWLARCSYLATLPPCSTDHRHKAERWIGLGKPQVYDLLEGWPSREAFARGGVQ